jgi:hypothetical protein
VTIVTPSRANADGFRWIAGALPASARFRDEARAGLIAAANAGTLAVPVARTSRSRTPPPRSRCWPRDIPGSPGADPVSFVELVAQVYAVPMRAFGLLLSRRDETSF